jgi:hypothetical protein
MKGISIKNPCNCWIIEEYINTRGQQVDPEKINSLSLTLQEFCQEEISPYLTSYIDFRILKYKKFFLVETAFEDEGIQLDKLSKFELGILFKDMRTHIRNMILTLSYLKVRLVTIPDWLSSANVMFNLETFTLKFCGYIVVDILKDEEKDHKDMQGPVLTKSSGKTELTGGKINP